MRQAYILVSMINTHKTLDEWMTENEITEAKLASDVGTTQPNINRIRNQIQVAGLRIAKRVYKRTCGEVCLLPISYIDGSKNLESRPTRKAVRRG